MRSQFVWKEDYDIDQDLPWMMKTQVVVLLIFFENVPNRFSPIVLYYSFVDIYIYDTRVVVYVVHK